MKIKLLALITLILLLQSCTNTTSPNNEIEDILDTDPYLIECSVCNTLDKRKNCTNKKIKELIAKNIIYPKEAKENKIEGRAIIKFIVKKDGSISFDKDTSDIIQVDPGSGCGEEALRLIKLFPKWIPGKRNGKAIDMYYTIRILFTLPQTKRNKDRLFIKPVRPPYPVPPPFDPPPLPPIGDEVYKIVEYMPHFAGCEDLKNKDERKKCSDTKLISFFNKNVRYPTFARESGIEGTTVIRFIIEKDGSLSNYEVLRDPGGGMGEEAVRVIKAMPKWIPGKHKGKPVRVEFTFPIRIHFAE